MNRRRCGSVRKLPSGRPVARGGGDRQVRGHGVDDAAGRVSFGDYAQHWLSTHPRLGPPAT